MSLGSNMGSKRWSGSELAIAFALLLCMVNCLLVAVLLTRIDPLFNGGVFVLGDLEGYLHFSFVLLALPVVASSVALVVIFKKRIALRERVLAAAERPREMAKLETGAIVNEEYATLEPTSKDLKASEVLVEEKKPEPVPREMCGISCPNCGKVTDAPLVKLDFSGDKAKLVDVCPYCNFVLGETEVNEENSQNSAAGENK